MTSANEIRLDIERRILGGALERGSRLPSVRELAATFGVAPGTAAAAYRQLSDSGLIVAGKGRQGTHVAPAVPRSSGHDELLAVESGVIDAQLGSPDPALLPSIVEALSLAGANRTTYGTDIVHPDLGRVAQRQFGRDEIDARFLTVTNGSMDAIDRALEAQQMRPGDRVGVEDPGHVPVHQLVRSAGLTPVPMRIDCRGVVPESLESALSQGVRAVIVTPRAQNPTGAAFDSDRAAALTAVLSADPQVMLIQDDHAGPVAGAAFHPLTAPGRSWAVVRSVGKALGPDLRVAVIAGDQDTVDRIAFGFSNGPGWVSHILQAAVAHLLEDPDACSKVEEANISYRQRREALIDALSERGVKAQGDSGFNVWVPDMNEQRAVEAARRSGFAISAGERWRIASQPAVRVSITALTLDDIGPLADAIASGGVSKVRRAAFA